MEQHDTWEPLENLSGAQASVDQYICERDAAEALEKKEAEAKRQAAVAAKRQREEVKLLASRSAWPTALLLTASCRSWLLN